MACMLRIIHALFVVLSFVPVMNLSAQNVDTLHYVLPEVEAVEAHLPVAVTSAVPLQRATREDFERLGFAGVSDVLQHMPGVIVRDYGGVGGLKTVSLRGMGAKHTAVSYDGVVVADAQSGVVDIGRFPLDNLSMVTLVVGQGGGSLLTARELSSSGLLSLRTLLPSKTTTTLSVKGGAFGLAGLSLFHRYKSSGRWGLSFNGNLLRSDGMYPFDLVNSGVVTREKRRDSDIGALSFEANADIALGGGQLDAKVYYYGSERGLPGAVNLYNKENSERLWNRNAFAQAKYRCSFGSAWDMQAVFKYDYNYSRYREMNPNYSAGEQVDINVQNECYASLGVGYTPLLGLDLSLATDASFAMLENNFENSKAPRRISSWTALSADYEFSILKFSASLLATYIADEVRGGNGMSPFVRMSPSVAVVVSPFRNDALHLRASFKDACRVPTFADLYYLRLGNVGLRPERATQYNLGVAWNVSGSGVLRNFAVTADGYYNNVRDKIVALPTMYVWRMMNFGEADIWGADVALSFRLALSHRVGLVADASYSFIYAIDVTDESAKNYRHQLPYTPQHTGGFTLSLENLIVNVSYLLSAVGDRYMLPQNTARNRMPGYLEHSFSLNRSFDIRKATLRLQCELLNITNEQYEVIKNYPMPGFSWRLSARVSF